MKKPSVSDNLRALSEQHGATCLIWLEQQTVFVDDISVSAHNGLVRVCGAESAPTQELTPNQAEALRDALTVFILAARG